MIDNDKDNIIVPFNTQAAGITAASLLGIGGLTLLAQNYSTQQKENYVIDQKHKKELRDALQKMSPAELNDLRPAFETLYQRAVTNRKSIFPSTRKHAKDVMVTYSMFEAVRRQLPISKEP